MVCRWSLGPGGDGYGMYTARESRARTAVSGGQAGLQGGGRMGRAGGQAERWQVATVAEVATVAMVVVVAAAAGAHRGSPVANPDRVETLRDDDGWAAVVEELVHLHRRSGGCTVVEWSWGVGGSVGSGRRLGLVGWRRCAPG